jgi:uncharacterized membrane protein
MSELVGSEMLHQAREAEQAALICALEARATAAEAQVAKLREALRACRRADSGGREEPRRNVREIVDEALETDNG